MRKYSYKKSKINNKLGKIIKELRKFEWKHHNLILFGISLLIAYYILKYKPIISLLSGLGYLGYLEAFVLGMLFTYSLTVAPATAALYNLGEKFHPLFIASIGALGAIISDYLIFRFVRDKLMNEIKTLSEEMNTITRPVSNLIVPENIRIRIWKRVSHSRIWRTLIPVIAGFIIASPLPDELGVAMFGAVKYETKKFILYSYCLNFIGILAITSLAMVL
jgi:hypothetical protein